MLTSNQAAAITKLCAMSPTERKKAIGADLSKAFDHEDIQACLKAAPLKGAALGDSIDNALQKILPANVFSVVQTFGPVLVNLILSKLKV